MRVIATAGHVDHGKSALIRALTGMEPDRWAEERRRGMTIDLGYAWLRLPSGEEIAFVDVPGHERFTGNMLAGVGPVQVVLLVVAADEGWSAQTEEHVRALDALGVRHGLLAVTKSDLTDPTATVADSRRRLMPTTLAGIDVVRVSARTGEGLDELRAMLGKLATQLPAADPGSRVRLWVDRSFTIRGAGTVVTGTLASGRVALGDVLELRGERVSVRGVQQLGQSAEAAIAPARVALNLRSVEHGQVRRGDALLTVGAWHSTKVADVRTSAAGVATQLVLHIGTAAVPVRVRELAGETALVRLALTEPLPLQVGDRAVLRDPGLRHVVSGVTVLDPAPPPLRRRGAARARAEALHLEQGFPSFDREVRRRAVVSRGLLAAIGVPIPEEPGAGIVEVAGWFVAHTRWAEWQAQVRSELASRSRGDVVQRGLSHAELAQILDLPTPRLLLDLVRSIPEVDNVGGHVRLRDSAPRVSAEVEAAIARLSEVLDGRPFAAPEVGQLPGLGFGRQELLVASTHKLVLRLTGDVVLLPSAVELATARLRQLPQPFTLSAAREALGTTRRVAVPLLEHLDRLRLTIRVTPSLRSVSAPPTERSIGVEPGAKEIEGHE